MEYLKIDLLAIIIVSLSFVFSILHNHFMWGICLILGFSLEILSLQVFRKELNEKYFRGVKK